MQEKYTTFLLGAGASYYSIPIIANFNNRMVAFSGYLANLESFGDEKFPSVDRITETIEEVKRQFIEDIDWLAKEAGKNSVDFVAKKYWDKPDREKYQKIKAIISAYLLLEQSVSDGQYTSLDYRCASWITKINIKENGFAYINPNYKVISWNYDLQIEKALGTITNFIDYDTLMKSWKIYPNPGRKSNEEISLGDISVVRLNGIAGLHIAQGAVTGTFRAAFEDFSKQLVSQVLRSYYLYAHKNEFLDPIFYYAWENSSFSEKAMSLSLEIANNTKDLIIIGYSFPDYNKDIDKKILSAFSSLERVDVQTNDADFAKIKDIFETYCPKVKKITLRDLDQYYLPY
ncbi:hypothetical protein [Leptospira wolffii]|uniref:hypothetical protein n=1 Tax=Leptospira wolffii TaxID=409998 RepID=UPI000353C4AA|nr:hypothetical protein [Leptospira wolffii]EPG64661.1 hypothetical protein LEP1GSC061_1006 [Leptospira wolffii serovar Khorat str. Khorat-H2]